MRTLRNTAAVLAQDLRVAVGVGGIGGSERWSAFLSWLDDNVNLVEVLKDMKSSEGSGPSSKAEMIPELCWDSRSLEAMEWGDDAYVTPIKDNPSLEPVPSSVTNERHPFPTPTFSLEYWSGSGSPLAQRRRVGSVVDDLEWMKLMRASGRGADEELDMDILELFFEFNEAIEQQITKLGNRRSVAVEFEEDRLEQLDWINETLLTSGLVDFAEAVWFIFEQENLGSKIENTKARKRRLFA